MIHQIHGFVKSMESLSGQKFDTLIKLMNTNKIDMNIFGVFDLLEKGKFIFI